MQTHIRGSSTALHTQAQPARSIHSLYSHTPMAVSDYNGESQPEAEAPGIVITPCEHQVGGHMNVGKWPV